MKIRWRFFYDRHLDATTFVSPTTGFLFDIEGKFQVGNLVWFHRLLGFRKSTYVPEHPYFNTEHVEWDFENIDRIEKVSRKGAGDERASLNPKILAFVCWWFMKTSSRIPLALSIAQWKLFSAVLKIGLQNFLQEKNKTLTEEQIVQGVNTHIPVEYTRFCLSRSLSRAVFLDAIGSDFVVAIGVFPPTPNMHAWIIKGGRPYFEDADTLIHYQPVLLISPK